MENSLVIDSREHKRIQSATKYYQDLGYDVTVSTLDTGDYLFNDQVVFEFKTMMDYMSSIVDGRVFRECILQSESYPYHFCIIQGSNYDLKRALDYSNVSYRQYVGSISRLNTYTTVINSMGGVKNAYHQMHTQTSKCLDDIGKVKQFKVKEYNTAFNILAYTIPRVSTMRADRIVETLGLETVTDVVNLTKEELLTVDGIGDNLAENIIKHIGVQV